MGKLPKGIIGPFTGKVGNLVGCTWKGMPYIRSRPKKTTTPPTEKQLETRFIFTMTQRWLKPLNDYLRVGFENYSRRVNGVAAAKSKLYESGLIRDGYNSSIDPSRVRISYGKLPFGVSLTMEFDRKTSEICLRWYKLGYDSELYGWDDDQLMAVAYNVETEQTYGELYGRRRSEGMQRIATPSEVPGTFHVYAAFISANRRERSMSKYIGKVEI